MTAEISVTSVQIASLRRKVWRFYQEHGRDLPFRHISSPYKITVSEIMLQQTQVERVIPYYQRWIKRWPSWRSLAGASAREALAEWSGLGYNRRALYLRNTARVISAEYRGQIPRTPAELMRLPGIGAYTARAILIFAFNEPLAAVDTNIRQVLTHELELPRDMSAESLQRIAERTLPRGRARDWHYALMDYARLGLDRTAKSSVPKPRQSPFTGSIRQIRGEIVRRLTTRPSVAVQTIARALDRTVTDVRRAASELERDGIVGFSADVIKLRK